MSVTGETQSSVGKVLAGNQIYSIDHPVYKNFAADVETQLAAIMDREVERRQTSQPVVFTSALTTDEASGIAQAYPEFAVKAVPLNNRVQAYWSASRLCANEWLAKTTAAYATDVVHFGGATSASLLQSRRGFHCEIDASDDVMVNEDHTDVVDVHRLYGDFAKLQKDHQVLMPRKEYDAYLNGLAHKRCKSPHTCTHKADAMCVDLSVVAVAPDQVALSMEQHGAQLCHGFFPYCPEMLVQDEGELGLTGVGFRRKEVNIYFSYPEGRAGVSYYPVSVWGRWLSSHTFSIGSGSSKKWYQLELLKHRECFMFFRIAKVPQPVGPVRVSHALDMPGNDDLTLVNSWRLKSGLRSEVADRSQWVEHAFLVRTRVVKRVYEYAMQLSAAQFSRYAIKKQIRLVNNRFVVNGTTVTVAPVLEPSVVEDLATAIFSRAFVDRYDSSRLSSEMMGALMQLVRFTSASWSERVVQIASAVATSAYLKTFGRFEKKVRSLMDYIRLSLGGGVEGSMKINLLPAPTYVAFHSVANGWASLVQANSEQYVRESSTSGLVPVVATSIGGSLATAVAHYAIPVGGLPRGLTNVMRVCTRLVDFRAAVKTDASEGLIDQVKSLNMTDSAREARYHVSVQVPEIDEDPIVSDFVEAGHPDPIAGLNDLYASAFPAVARSALESDTFSLSLDPQDRTLAAPYLRMPTYFGLPPNPRWYYRSKLQALGVPKRQNTAQELLSAISARNLTAPAISVPQEEGVMLEIWDNFIDTMCVEDAREKLANYQADPVALSEDALREWVGKAKPDAVDRIRRELSDSSKSLEQMQVSEYLAMLKADVKPTLSNKPVTEVTAPQVIVYHEKPLSAMYSSIIRVLVQRFMSLLKPNVFVNLLKDTDHISKLLTSIHPFGQEKLQYLENDFSKYDKSQSQFAFDLEHLVFTRLGMNADMLAKWLNGHVDCSIRAVTVGLSLHVMYQRKSGDATTAFGNVILNILSVAYAYRGTKVVWALFMGDDSLVCASVVNSQCEPVQLLAEVFNLTAKYYITDAPYFASNFVIVDDARLEVKLVPDPIKRVERLSMMISADDPQWEERYESFKDSMSSFKDPEVASMLARRVPVRYEVPEGMVRGAASALGTLVSSFRNFRAIWEAEPEIVEG